MKPQTYTGGLDYLSRSPSELIEPYEKKEVSSEEFIAAVSSFMELLPHASHSTYEKGFGLINDAIIEVIATRPDLPYTSTLIRILERKDLTEAAKLFHIQEIKLDHRPEFDSEITKNMYITPDAVGMGQFRYGFIGLRNSVSLAGTERGFGRSANRRELGIRATGLTLATSAASSFGYIAAHAEHLSGKELVIAIAGGSGAALGAAFSRRSLTQVKNNSQETIIAAAQNVATTIKEPLAASLPVRILPSAQLDPAIAQIANDIKEIDFPKSSNMPRDKWNPILARLTDASLPYAGITQKVASEENELHLLENIRREQKGKKARKKSKEIKAKRRLIDTLLTEYDPLRTAIREIAIQSEMSKGMNKAFEGMEEIARVNTEKIKPAELELRAVTLLHIMHNLTKSAGKKDLDGGFLRKVKRAAGIQKEVRRMVDAKWRSEKALSLLNSYLNAAFDTDVEYQPEEYQEELLSETLQLLKSSVEFMDEDADFPDSLYELVDLMDRNQPRHYGQEKKSSTKQWL